MVEQRAYPAYSPNDEVLYINWQYNSGAILLLQYNLKDADPNATYFLAAEPLEGTGDMQLGPDGKIYMATAEQSTVTSKVSIIQNPNQLGPGCNFQDKAINMNSWTMNTIRMNSWIMGMIRMNCWTRHDRNELLDYGNDKNELLDYEHYDHQFHCMNPYCENCEHYPFPAM